MLGPNASQIQSQQKTKAINQPTPTPFRSEALGFGIFKGMVSDGLVFAKPASFPQFSRLKKFQNLENHKE